LHGFAGLQTLHSGVMALFDDISAQTVKSFTSRKPILAGYAGNLVRILQPQAKP